MRVKADVRLTSRRSGNTIRTKPGKWPESYAPCVAADLIHTTRCCIRSAPANSGEHRPNREHPMPFFRPLNETAPQADTSYWPIDGLAYVVAFTGPVAASLAVGVLARDWRVFAVGIPAGIGITLLNAWLSDRFFDPLVAKFQRQLKNGIPWVLTNLVAFAWVIALSALPMFVPFLVLGDTILTQGI